MRRKKALFSLAFLLMTCVGLVSSTIAADIDLTGSWNCTAGDTGIFYIRQIGHTVWWYGESSDVNPQWSNVANGKVVSNGKRVKLNWADVPKGYALQNGALQIKVDSNDHLTRTSETGGFACSEWTRID